MRHGDEESAHVVNLLQTVEYRRQIAIMDQHWQAHTVVPQFRESNGKLLRRLNESNWIPEDGIQKRLSIRRFQGFALPAINRFDIRINRTR
jgi:hypothetical protein